MSKRSRQVKRRETEVARNVEAIKTQFKSLLGFLDPISAVNFLHNEGMVSHSEKEEFDRHLSDSFDEDSDIRRSGSLYMYSGETLPAVKDSKAKLAAKLKLAEIVDKKEHHELKAIVTALSAFTNLHRIVKEKRSTSSLRSEADETTDMTTPLVPSIEVEEESSVPAKPEKKKRISRQEKAEDPLEEKILAAFEHGTHSPEELIEFLKESKDQCNISEISNFEGKTLLHLACCMQPVPVVEALVNEYDCDPNAQDNDGNTPLHEASRCRKIFVARFLVNLPTCDPNILNNNKETPLHVAITRKHWRLSKTLVRSSKIDKTVENANGQTVISLLDRNPENPDCAKMKKRLERSASLYSMKSMGSMDNGIEEENGSIRRSISFGEDSTVSFNKKVPPSSLLASRSSSSKKLVRNPSTSSIQNRQLDNGWSDPELGSSNKTRRAHTTTKKDLRMVAFFDVCSISLKIGFFVFSLLLCLAILVCLIYFLVKKSEVDLASSPLPPTTKF